MHYMKDENTNNLCIIYIIKSSFHLVRKYLIEQYKDYYKQPIYIFIFYIFPPFVL